MGEFDIRKTVSQFAATVQLATFLRMFFWVAICFRLCSAQPFHTTASLSQARMWSSTASTSDLILFAGGTAAGSIDSAVVDLYNVSSQRWSVSSLSVARGGVSGAAFGSKAYFAGGIAGGVPSAVVDIFDTRTGMSPAKHAD